MSGIALYSNFLSGVLHVPLLAFFKLDYLGILDIGCWRWGFIFEWNNLLQAKSPLVIGGTRTQVLADSMVIAASALNHCTT